MSQAPRSSSPLSQSFHSPDLDVGLDDEEAQTLGFIGAEEVLLDERLDARELLIDGASRFLEDLGSRRGDLSVAVCAFNCEEHAGGRPRTDDATAVVIARTGRSTETA